MENPKLIILYGKLSESFNDKQQLMIDGKCTCGYRSYAQKFGKIIYLSNQKVRKDWELSITNSIALVRYLNNYKDAIVWSVKHDERKDLKVFKHLSNKRLYYSCNSKDMYNKYADYSLVDTEKRIKSNAKLFFKGKDENFWINKGYEKKYDYLLIGKRADKNEIYFINKLNEISEKRNILWIGGEKHRDKVNTRHNIRFTPFEDTESVLDHINYCKVGILFTDHKAEGFPQSFLEMTMCGVPVVYSDVGPRNSFYFKENNHVIANYENLHLQAEKLLKTYNPELCRQDALNYTLDKSFKYMESLFE
jgi:glycosyltransferase involved in cell wall biosynthesis